MGKIVLPLFAVGSLGVLAAPALAGNSGAPPGPPEITGGPSPGAFVLHCIAAGGESVFVFNSSGIHRHFTAPCG
jgi:hypothetical protein